MTKMTLKLFGAALVSGLLLNAPAALAGPSIDSLEMKKALAKAEQGPEELRRFVQRTRMIYGLDYSDVMRHHVASKAAEATQTATTATATQTATAAEARK